MMEFLYFPQDKSEYIPALLTLLVFIVGAAVTMYFIIKVSRKEEERTDYSPVKEEQDNYQHNQ
ncbi:hypothetical protein [Halobacillus naozhouensis]|uniref:Tumour necrosis factor receptor superfamily member 19 n=1 Tax=Halobacillus naozhouensis TaxID=554880 RepID=A0ABY8IV48_9BACI|nr:hypothetical protein [Halobacillus naozhouensis]WFT73576.1 hypothetical protein P9989_14470 [Halobacillus naozhouensis]